MLFMIYLQLLTRHFGIIDYKSIPVNLLYVPFHQIILHF
nr:MAG TPA: hypothetical protein [Caudoviricetes sp.]